MADLTDLARVLVDDAPTSLLLAVTLSFAFLPVCVRLWWAHGLLALLLFTASIFGSGPRQLALDGFLIATAAFPALCRNIPNTPLLYRAGIAWFALFALLATLMQAESSTTRPLESEILVVEKPLSNLSVERRYDETSSVFARNSRWSGVLGDPLAGQRMGLRGPAVRLFLEPVMARGARLPSSDVQAHTGYEKTGLLLAYLSGSRHRSTWL